MLDHCFTAVIATTGRSGGGITKERWQKARKWGIS